MKTLQTTVLCFDNEWRLKNLLKRQHMIFFQNPKIIQLLSDWSVSENTEGTGMCVCVILFQEGCNEYIVFILSSL